MNSGASEVPVPVPTSVTRRVILVKGILIYYYRVINQRFIHREVRVWFSTVTMEWRYM